MNAGGLDTPSLLFPSSKNGATEDGEFPAVPWPGYQGPCAVSLPLREVSGPGWRGRARSFHARTDPQPAGTAEPFGLGVPVPEARAQDVSCHGAPASSRVGAGSYQQGLRCPKSGRRCETPVTGVAARAPIAGKGFSSARGDSRAGLERAAGKDRCFQHCEVPAARGRRCPWANRSDRSVVAGSNRGFTTGEVRAVDLISAVQTEVRETLQDGCFPPPSFLIGKS